MSEGTSGSFVEKALSFIIGFIFAIVLGLGFQGCLSNRPLLLHLRASFSTSAYGHRKPFVFLKEADLGRSSEECKPHVSPGPNFRNSNGSFQKLRPLLGVLTIRIIVYWAPFLGPSFLKTPKLRFYSPDHENVISSLELA